MNSWLLVAQDAGDAVGFGLGMFVLFAILGVIGLIVWIWALVDAIKNPALNDSERIIWVVVIVLLQLLGAIIYLIVGRKGGHRSSGVTP